MSAPSVSWRTRVLRRTAGSVGAAVVMAGVVPALANAAGADVANPVAIALRASGETISSALGTADEATTPCTTPTATPDATVSSEPAESVTPTDPTASAEPVDPTASVEPVDPTASVEPVEPTVSVEPVEPVEPSEAPDEECETPEATPSTTESETPEAEESEAAEEPEDSEKAEGHGKVVSTVATCAPRGKDPLLDVEGSPANHGGYVRAAAHGETLTTPWGEFDLSTQAGADALCAAVEAARAELPETGDGKAKRDKAERAKKDRGAKHAKPAKPAKDKDAKGKGRPGS